jgi:hypothetical protein
MMRIDLDQYGHYESVPTTIMTTDEHPPHSAAPNTGLFEEHNIFGAPTGVVAFVTEGEPLPGAPRNFTWRSLADHSIEELRGRAAGYRTMAAEARTTLAKEGLLKLADRFDALANRREA